MLKDTDRRPVVLSADDDENAHILLKRAFLKSGEPVSLYFVNDGAEAVSYLLGEGKFADRASFPLPNLLLLDLKMPRVSGFGVLERLGQRSLLQTLPVIVFSSSNKEEDVEKAYALKCHSYVVKPVDFEKLVELVAAIRKEFLSGQSKHAENKQTESGYSRFTVPAISIRSKNNSESMTDNEPTLNPNSPEIFKLLVDQVKDYAIFMLDKEGHVLSWNEGARRLKGYESHEVIGKHFSMFYPRLDRDGEKPQFELRMALQMGRYEEEGWRMRKDGSRFWANVIVTPLRNAEGKLQGFAKVTRDLTQRKLQEENLQRLLDTEERFRLLVEQVRDYAIFMLDAKGNISSWNQGARRIKGYSADEIIGKHFSIFYTPEDLKRDYPTYELSVAIREGRYEDEGWRVKKDGSWFWANVVITAVWDKRGNLTGFAKVTRDLTERKKESDLLRQKTEELEAFAHTLSHDLRSPLRSISSFAQILNRGDTDLSGEEKKEYLSKISKSAKWMENLINDILKFSQMNMAPAPEELVPLDSVLDECTAILESEIQRTKAQIRIRRPLPLVKANRTLVTQVFSNLLSNALKFVPEGKTPKVEIYSLAKEKRCEIHVKDEGVGIPQAFQQSIFKLFERGAAENRTSGSGVGLAIVKKATERMGGRIDVQSKEGEGSDFVVTLPCEQPSSGVPAGVALKIATSIIVFCFS